MREKKQRTINENIDMIGLNKVAKQKTTNIPHHVFTLRVILEKSFSLCFLLICKNKMLTTTNPIKIINKVQMADDISIPPIKMTVFNRFLYCIIKHMGISTTLKEGMSYAG
ncbi:hypothetical protein [Rossellomorea arthrocnemi]|uniref:hypothetical protein n=1 Tax=Rossellomorea arthrocnemi TaxID=2769542 RepID=UPI001E4F8F5E|nr:hypothetical protein [Rossellomorea arthrocnemi]